MARDRYVSIYLSKSEGILLDQALSGMSREDYEELCCRVGKTLMQFLSGNTKESPEEIVDDVLSQHIDKISSDVGYLAEDHAMHDFEQQNRAFELFRDKNIVSLEGFSECVQSKDIVENTHTIDAYVKKYREVMEKLLQSENIPETLCE